jgi:hypothetical protein
MRQILYLSYSTMNQPFYLKEIKSKIKNLTLIITAFVSVFFPRIISSLGVPTIINFAHLLIVPVAFIVAIITTKTKDRKQKIIFWETIFGSLFLLGIILASALLNQAGVGNAILDFILMTEPFMLLLAIVCIPLSTSRLDKLRGWLLGSAVVNLFLAVAQYFLIEFGIMRVTSLSPADNVQGVFYLSGAGNYVSVSVSISVALYYFVTAKKKSIYFRYFWLLASIYQLLISDSKQILVVFVAAWLFLSLTKLQNLGRSLMYLIALVLFLVGFYWAIQSLDIIGLGAFKYWAGRTELYGPNGEGTQAKISGIRMIISYFKSPLNWFLGLGPGHTIGRLGGWILRDYSALLAPLNTTIHPVTQEVWNFVRSNWVVQESSMFMPIFSWAGIWGDLGFLGLGAYLYLGYVVWNRLCHDDISKFLMMSMFVYGLIFTQMEEPGQSLTVATLIGLRWQEQHIAKQTYDNTLQLLGNPDNQGELN